MKTHYITQENEIISTNSHIVDTGEVLNATIIIENTVDAKYTIVPKNGDLKRHIILKGENYFSGKGVITENGNVTIQTEVMGDEVETMLDILTIATENSKISVQGEAKVDKPYKRLNVRVDQINILIGQNTQVRGVPRLEIATNDIEGGHSCKIHRLGGDALFYLESHGLNKENAEVFLLNSEIIKHLDNLPEDSIEIFCSNVHKKLLAKK